MDIIISIFDVFRNLVTEVYSKADVIIKTQSHQSTVQVQSFDQLSILREVRDSLNTINHETQKNSRIQHICPCATNTVVMIIAVAQAFLFIVYAIYK